MTVEVLSLFVAGLSLLTFFWLRVRVLDHDGYVAEMAELLEEARSRGDYRKAIKISRAIKQAQQI